MDAAEKVEVRAGKIELGFRVFNQAVNLKKKTSNLCNYEYDFSALALDVITKRYNQ